MTKPGTFKTADVAKLYRAAKQAGLAPETLEIEVRPDGALVLRPTRSEGSQSSLNPWDEELRR